MTYQVLARSWRPRAFAEMVGQEHVLRALIHALDSGRVHHAFLFTGTRGVGKTTIARILAKALNCDTGVSSRPCGVCSACRAIDEGRFVDLIEVDAASRTKVEDTRELLENVQYTPTSGRYKVYLIDEVHMFSNHSFNALLKTLEEPPPHVKFLLATTDPQRLPVTILSRCLQFNLRRLPIPLIAAQLARILTAENVPYEDDALRELARAADGSMRDGLSLLDQAIAHGGGQVRAEQVHAMLGTIARDRVYELLEHLSAFDAPALIAATQALAESSPDWGALLGELTGLLQRIALGQFVPAAVDDHLGDRARILSLAQRLSREDVQLYYQIGLLGLRDLPLAPQPQAGFEMTLLRMLAFRPAPEDNSPRPAPQPRIEPVPPPPNPAPITPPAPPPSSPQLLTELNWSQLVPTLGLGGFTKQIALNSSLVRINSNTLELATATNISALINKERTQELEAAVRARLGDEVRIKIHLQQHDTKLVPTATPAQVQEQARRQRNNSAQQSIENDPTVHALQESFDAKIISNTIKPKNSE